MNNGDLQFIQNRISYRFNNLDLLQQAFIRRSYSKENGGEDNEVLEFIGDKVLDFIVTKWLAEKFGYFLKEYDKNEDFDEFACEYNENQLTEIKKAMVRKESLSQCIDMLGLADFLIMGKGDRKKHVENEMSVKEDLFEAIIGAVALDCKWDTGKIQDVVEYMLQPENYCSDSDEEDYVCAVQDWCLKHCGQLPDIQTESFANYNIFSDLGRSTPTINSNRYSPYGYSGFCTQLQLPGIDKIFMGAGHSKNEARKDACQEAYNYLDENDMLFTIRDEIENPSRDMAINQLETLARRGYFSIPYYEFDLHYDNQGNPVWNCECHIEEEDYYFYEKASSKKEAKKSAAYSMLLHVLGTDD